MPELVETLKALMRSFPQGVTLVTSAGPDGPFGVTVSAFSSISLSPPMIMVSMNKGTKAHEVMSAVDRFAVNILAADQSQLSERFAGRSPAHNFDFHGLPVRRGENGSPILQTAVGYIECTKLASHDAGDHTMIMGQVTAAFLSHDAPPLVYFKRSYTTVVPPTGHPGYDSLLGEW